MNALIIKKPWVDLILTGKKVWEIRGCNTKKRGLIEIIQSGSGKIVGCCNLVDCIKLDIDEYKKSVSKHCIEDVKTLPYKATYAWIISDPCRYEVPKEYKHPKGAVIWVKL